MNYKLRFHELALKEWNKLDGVVQLQFKKKLEERLINPRVASSKLRKMKDCYKIKLRTASYRLIYRVEDKVLFVSVIAVGKRAKNKAYRLAEQRQ